MSGIELTPLDGELAIVRLAAGEPTPGWAQGGGAGLVSTTATAGETSVVCAAASVPDGLRTSPGWRALVVTGPLDHSLTGILASLAAPLAAAEVPIFAISTFDTDYVLVPEARIDDALAALRDAGHRIAGGGAAG